MKKDNGKQNSSRLRSLWVQLAILAVIVGGVTLLFLWFTHNYAQDAAKPFEKVLADGGAVRKCSVGDPGRGPDNFSPNYETLYELAADKEAAVQLVEKSANQNGYSLTHQSSPYSYINWYFGTPGKKNSDSKAKITFSVYSDGEKKLHCGNEPLRSDSTHTAISLGVSLPTSQ